MIENIKEAVKTLLVAGVVLFCLLWPQISSAPAPDETALTTTVTEILELVARLATAVVALLAYIKSLLRKDEIELEMCRLSVEERADERAHEADLLFIEKGGNRKKK